MGAFQHPPRIANHNPTGRHVAGTQPDMPCSRVFRDAIHFVSTAVEEAAPLNVHQLWIWRGSTDAPVVVWLGWDRAFWWVKAGAGWLLPREVSTNDGLRFCLFLPPSLVFAFWPHMLCQGGSGLDGGKVFAMPGPVGSGLRTNQWVGMPLPQWLFTWERCCICAQLVQNFGRLESFWDWSCLRGQFYGVLPNTFHTEALHG